MRRGKGQKTKKEKGKKGDEGEREERKRKMEEKRRILFLCFFFRGVWGGHSRPNGSDVEMGRGRGGGGGLRNP